MNPAPSEPEAIGLTPINDSNEHPTPTAFPASSAVPTDNTNTPNPQENAELARTPVSLARGENDPGKTSSPRFVVLKTGGTIPDPLISGGPPNLNRSTAVGVEEGKVGGLAADSAGVKQPMLQKTPADSKNDDKIPTVPPGSPDPRNSQHRGSIGALYSTNQIEKQNHYALLSSFLGGFTVPKVDKEESDSKANTQKAAKTKPKAKLGTILGVFLPDVQNVFGILMFLRLYWLVGMAGVHEAFWLVFMCCACTFLTSISLSAIATNGVMQSGGPYFMISRNLGPQIGAGVGLLFYMANTIATAMYVAGGIEILIKYIAPQIPAFYKDDDKVILDLENTVRAYGTVMLLLTFGIVFMGVKFVQWFAPFSLFSVLLSILAVFIGGFLAGNTGSTGVQICLLDDQLLRYQIWNNESGPQCTGAEGSMLHKYFCTGNATEEKCESLKKELQFTEGFPGLKSGTIKKNAKSHYTKKEEKSSAFAYQDLATNFFVLLAIYFPSVTGILTGCNMSGDLKDPQKSLPVGTLAAQIFTSVVYLGLVIIFGGAIHGSLLRDKYGDGVDGGLDNKGYIRGGGMIIAKFAWPNEWIVLIGSFASTFGAGLQSLCSAPRLLQSIAKDDLVPKLKFFAHSSRTGEPLKALFLTAFISECAVLLGQVDQIAPILDYFFLMCYCFINLSCAVQTLVKAPNWRPRFRYYHWSLSLTGALLCIFIMWATHWYYALAVWIACIIVYKIVEMYGAKKEWGSGLRGLALSAAQFSLLKYDDDVPHAKNWRPQLLVFVKPSEVDTETGQLGPKAKKMLGFAGQMKGGQGLSVITSLLPGNVRDEVSRQLAQTIKAKLKSHMKDMELPGFASVILVSDEAGAPVNTIMQSGGIGGLRPNTLIIGWPSGWRNALQNPDPTHNRRMYLRIFQECINNATATGFCLTICKGVENFPEPNERLAGSVDVWWIVEDGGLLLLLPYLLQKQLIWKKCRMRVFAVAGESDNSIKMKEALENWCYQLRIVAEVTIVELEDEAISAFTQERTMQMADRANLARKLKMSQKEKSKHPQFLRDAIREESTTKLPKIVTPGGTKEVKGQTQLQNPEGQNPLDTKSSSHTPIGRKGSDPDQKSTADVSEAASTGDRSERVKKMHEAIRLNGIIRANSKNAQLVFLNLPKLTAATFAGFIRYLEYIEALSEDLQKVVFVKSSGQEVITIYT